MELPEIRGVGSLRVGICQLLEGRPRHALEQLERARELLGTEFETQHEQELCLTY